MSLRARLGLIIAAVFVLALIGLTTAVIMGASEAAETANWCLERTGTMDCE